MAISATRESGASAEALVPVIRYVDQAEGCDLSMVPEAVRPHAFRSYQHQQVGILVSDMSGFTKLTRKYGAIHFTSIIARTRQLCLPILHKFGAMLITAEGDSLNVVFATAEGAVLAALDMQRVAQENNRNLPDARAHFALTLDGVGVDYGPGPILDREGKLHGQVFANAHLLGEELCTKGRVAISQSCYNQVKDIDSFASAICKPMPLPENKEAHEAIEAMGGIFEVAMEFSEPICVTPFDSAGYLQESLLKFCRRHSPIITVAELVTLDTEISRQYLQKKVVLMLEFEFVNVDTPSTALGLKFDCLSRLAEILRAHRACNVEDVLYFFDDPVDAILAATKCRAAVDALKERACKDDAQVFIKGFGVHTGELLVVEGTDVHWGDPVNTASKLGQDFASGAEIIISEATFDSCSGDPRLTELRFEKFEVEISGVKFEPYKVNSRPPTSTVSGGSTYHNFVLYQADQSPRARTGCQQERDKNSILEAMMNSGFAPDVPLDSKVISEFMRILDPNYTNEQVAETMAYVQKGSAAQGGITLPALVEWAFPDAVDAGTSR